MPHFPEKAYKNLRFLNSPAARPIRILCEYEETRQRIHDNGVENTIVFFGSARARCGEATNKELVEAQDAVKANPEDQQLQDQLLASQKNVRLSEYYDQARELSRRITEWTLNRPEGWQYFICTGGGPGIMEAGNRGAADAGGRSVGLGISLPFEPGVNDWVTLGLDFEFHYFFTRKYWFLYLCEAMVVFPGGFGTMDEFFETLTLLQTKKIKKHLPIVVFGKEYWDAVIRLEPMVSHGTISPQDQDLFFRTDSVDEAFEFLTARLIKNEADPAHAH
jgi:uncharacterized protein (TIGR00730 family)